MPYVAATRDEKMFRVVNDDPPSGGHPDTCGTFCGPAGDFGFPASPQLNGFIATGPGIDWLNVLFRPANPALLNFNAGSASICLDSSGSPVSCDDPAAANFALCFRMRAQSSLRYRRRVSGVCALRDVLTDGASDSAATRFGQGQGLKLGSERQVGTPAGRETNDNQPEKQE
jgi:hypothetical protein